MSLRVLVDGEPLREEEARALWSRFSAWMESNKGDLKGFAEREGFASVHPSVDQGQPVLLASRTQAQGPYVSIAQHPPVSGGSPGRQKSRNKPRRRRSPP